MIRSMCVFENTLFYCHANIPILLTYLNKDLDKIDQCQIINYQGRCKIVGGEFIENNLKVIVDILKLPYVFTKTKSPSKNTSINKIVYVPIENEYEEDVEIIIESQ